MPTEYPGGPVPAVMMVPLQVSEPLRVGHTSDFHDPSAPVHIAEVIQPGTAETDLRCPDCVSTGALGRAHGSPLLVIEHEHGCPRLAELAARP